ncbi:hypothetical protein ACFC5X_29425 [Streptomyces sp. NPDC055952]|uniref:hypothetical protein n=1 Tax=Streptomyces sp. NPDC055952 TaxID=3345663 RepID=UPI0035DCF5F3
MNHQAPAAALPQPLRAVASGLKHLPGADQVGKVATEALDRIGAVSPRGRRMAVYAGAGVLGVAGIVEWPVALTGAAVAWLTQPRPGPRPDGAVPDGSGPAGTTGDTTSGGREEPDISSYGPGDRLAASHYRRERPEQHVHEQPAKVGDTATATALKQVHEAAAHGEDRGQGQDPATGRPTG